VHFVLIIQQLTYRLETGWDMYFQQLFNQAIQSVATSYHSLGILPH
jgi:hypothetical protein